MYSTLPFHIFDLFSGEGLTDVEIEIKDPDGVVLEVGTSDDNGRYYPTLEMMSTFTVITKCEGYIDME